VRSALFLLGGMVLLGAGIAVIALGVSGGLVVGPALIVAGLLVKVAGVLTLDAGPTPPAGSGRTVTTLGIAPPARGGATTGRTSALRRARTARAARATARATEAARAAALQGTSVARPTGRSPRAS
jgi:hypothetical protein